MNFGAIQSVSESIQFNIEIYQVQVSDSGWYNTCLTLDGQGSDAIVITAKHDGSELFGKAITDFQEVDTEGIAKFTKNNYSFAIPQNFINRPEIKLLIYINRTLKQDDPNSSETLYATGDFKIYPRQENRSHSDKYYQLEEEIKLYSDAAGSSQSTPPIVGKLNVAASLKGKIPPNADPSSDPNSDPKQAANTANQPSPTPDNATNPEEHKPEPLQQNSTTPVPLNVRKVTESPLPPNDGRIHHLAGHEILDDQKEYILARIYCATNVSNASTGPPQPYVLGKYGRQSAVTKATTTNTNAPFWNEVLVIEENLQSQENEVLTLSIIDRNTKELLEEYLIPIGHFSPIRPYHLELVQPSEVSSSETRFYVTLVKKPSNLPQHIFHHTNYGLEIKLNGFDSYPSHQVYSVIRILSDYQNYIDSALKSKPRQAYFSFTTLQFPSPHPSSLASIISQHNIPPQITSQIKEDKAMADNEKPQVTIYSEKEDIFTNSSGIVVEFYSVPETLKETCFTVSHPFAYCYLDSNEELLKSLRTNNVNKTLAIQGTENELSFGPYPPQQITLSLKLLSKQAEITNAPKTPIQDVQPSPINLPPSQPSPYHDRNNQEQPKPADPIQSRERTPEANNNFFPSSPKRDRLLLSPTTPAKSIAQSQPGNEVDYLKEQIKALKDELDQVKDENRRLRREINSHDDFGLIDEDYVGDIPHDELVQEYLALKQKYVAEAIQSREFRAKVQDLQNTLIKKNDNEKRYIKMEKSHDAQQKELRKLQDKMKTVQKWKDVCRNQEKVIQKMELMINTEGSNPNEPSSVQILRIENRKLLTALQQEKEKNNNKSKFDQERLEIYQKLDRAEARNKSLEAQMIEDARRWAKEKSDFQIRLSEQSATAYAKSTAPSERGRKNGRKAVSPSPRSKAVSPSPRSKAVSPSPRSKAVSPAPRSKIHPKLDPYD